MTDKCADLAWEGHEQRLEAIDREQAARTRWQPLPEPSKALGPPSPPRPPSSRWCGCDNPAMDGDTCVWCGRPARAG